MDTCIIDSHLVKFKLLTRALESSRYVFLTGPRSVGKTFMAKKALHDAGLNYAYINCNDIDNVSLLLIGVLRQFECQKLLKKEKLPNKILTPVEFQNIIARIRSNSKKRLYVILDAMEAMEDELSYDYLKILSNVDGLNMILISIEPATEVLNLMKESLAWKFLYGSTFTLHIPPWTTSEIVEQIVQEAPRQDKGLYKKFVENTVKVFQTHDYFELRSICQRKFSDFLNRAGDKTGIQSVKVLVEFAEQMKRLRGNQTFVDPKDVGIVPKAAEMLLALYIAAHTSQANDKINFVDLQKKTAKRPKLRHNENDGEARVFSLERLLHIYVSLQSNIFTESNGDGDTPELIAIPDSALGLVQLFRELAFIKIVTGDGYDSSSVYRISDYITRPYVETVASAILKEKNFSLDHLNGL